MNFVGHAMAAGWERVDARFVLGSMLPDFAHMSAVRLDPPEDEVIAAGSDHHHRVDASFHETAGFRTLCADARVALRTAEVRRPTALAAAHVGVELLLDGYWLEDSEVALAYQAALDLTDRISPAVLGCRDPQGAGRLVRLLDYLRAAGPPHDYRDPAEVGRRVTRILARRPRLAATPDDAPRLVEWARRAQPSVRAGAPALRAELRDALRLG